MALSTTLQGASGELQASSDKRQATSVKQQASSIKRQVKQQALNVIPIIKRQAASFAMIEQQAVDRGALIKFYVSWIVCLKQDEITFRTSHME